jgi:hypothetical protein
MVEGAQTADNSERSVASNQVERSELSRSSSLGTASLADMRLPDTTTKDLPSDFGSANNLTISGTVNERDRGRGAGSLASNNSAANMEVMNPGNNHPSTTPGGMMNFPHPVGKQVEEVLKHTIPPSIRPEPMAGGTHAAQQGRIQSEQAHQPAHGPSSTREWHRGERLRR